MSENFEYKLARMENDLHPSVESNLLKLKKEIEDNLLENIDAPLASPNLERVKSLARERSSKNIDKLLDGKSYSRYGLEFDYKGAMYTEQRVEDSESLILRDHFREELSALLPYVNEGEIGMLVTNVSEGARKYKILQRWERVLSDYNKMLELRSRQIESIDKGHKDYRYFVANVRGLEKTKIPKAKRKVDSLTQELEEHLDNEGLSGEQRAKKLLEYDSEQQRLYLITNQNEQAVFLRKMIASTGEAGYGTQRSSKKTPLGLLSVNLYSEKNRRGIEKYYVKGEFGQRIRSRKAQEKGSAYTFDAPAGSRIITSSLIYMNGEEEQNKNSNNRGIGIHATSQEWSLKYPSTWGCVVMTNLDLLSLEQHILDNKQEQAYMYVTDKAEIMEDIR